MKGTFRFCSIAARAVVDIQVVVLSSREPGRLWSSTASLTDQVVTEKGWAACLPAHTSYTPTCPSAALTTALKHKICFELTVLNCVWVCMCVCVCVSRCMCVPIIPLPLQDVVSEISKLLPLWPCGGVVDRVAHGW